ncbi:MAG: hypothetical protein QNJ72_36555 [Pleurocapsa sp. MO_226.B13]|nr:hypothetical protein [Pleurocapsa sp. MO_226.B13]
MTRYVEEIPSLEYVLLGIDHTAWGRRVAKTLKDRTYEHSSSSNNSVTVGQGYSTIAWLPEKQGSPKGYRDAQRVMRGLRILGITPNGT